MPQEKMSQSKVVLKHLQSGKTISQREATKKYGILRLGAIIFNLRKEGYKIITLMEHKPNRYGNTSHFGVYKLIQEEK